MAFTVKQNDTSPSMQATLKNPDLSPVVLTGASVQLHMKPLGGVIKIDAAMFIVDDANGLVQYDWVAGDTDTVGTYYVEFQVTFVDGSIETFPNNGNAAVTVVKELS
jgi:hypothetical protein